MGPVSTDPAAHVDLEVLFAQSIPCHGCEEPAQLRSRGHGCKPGPFYGCVDCWQDWYRGALAVLMAHGGLRCPDCKALFFDIESFSDYRSF